LRLVVVVVVVVTVAVVCRRRRRAMNSPAGEHGDGRHQGRSRCVTHDGVVHGELLDAVGLDRVEHDLSFWRVRFVVVSVFALSACVFLFF